MEKLTLDKKTTYRITVSGDVLKYRNGWERIESAYVHQDEDGQYLTTFICCCDQAGLHGLLRSLYSKGLPLVQIMCEGYETLEKN